MADYVDQLDGGIKAWEEQLKKEEALENDLKQIAEYVADQLTHKVKFGETFQVDYDGRLFSFTLRIGISKRHARVDMLTASTSLIVKPRKFKASVELSNEVTLTESVRFQVKSLLYNYYDLYDEEDGVAYDNEE